MTDESKLEPTVTPQTDEALKQGETKATIPESGEEITVPIKFNKEIKELDLSTAASLAQKGMKYEAIKEDYALLKKLANQENLSVPALLQNLLNQNTEKRKNELAIQCGGNEEMADHIFQLENNKENNEYGLNELTLMFPEIKTEEDVPPEVLEKSKARGTLLLDEFLRYKLLNERNLKAMTDNRKKAENSSLGSQQNSSGASNPEAEEFLKGLWK